MRVLAILAIALALALAVSATTPSLASVEKALEEKHVMSQATMGSFFGPIEKVLKQDHISLTNVTTKVGKNPYSLRVNAIGHVGSVDVPMVVVLQNGSTTEAARGLNLDVKVGVSITVQAADWPKVFAQIYGSMPVELKGVNGAGAMTFAFANTAIPGFQEGLLVNGSVSITNDVYLKPFRALNPHAQSFNFKLNLFAPVFTDGAVFNFDLTETGLLHVTSSISMGDASLHFDMVTKQYSIGGTLAVQLHGDREAEVAATAAYSLDSDSFKLAGHLVNPVSRVLGLQWLGLQTAQTTVVISHGAFSSLDMAATMNTTASPTPVDATVHVGAGDQIAVQLKDMPVSSLAALVEDVQRGLSQKISGAEATGTVTVSIANYAGAAFAQGISIGADVKLTNQSTAVAKASKAINPSAGATTEYKASLYVPAFGAKAPLDISFSATGSFTLRKDLSCSAYALSLKVGDDQTAVDVSATMTAHVGSPAEDVGFTASGSWSAAAGFDLAGSLNSDWANALGTDWLTLKAASKVDVHVGGSQAFTFTIQGGADLSFAPSSTPAQFELEIGHGALSNVVVSVTKVPLRAFDEAFDKIAKRPAPSSVKDAKVTGTAGLSFCNYAGADVAEGITLTADVTVSGETALGRAMHVLTTAPRTYVATLAVNPFAAQKTIDFSVMETGKVQVSSALTVDSYGVTMDEASSFEMKLTSQIELSLRHSSTPLTLALSGDYDGSAHSVTLEGSMVGTWPNAFGAKWLTLDSLDAKLSAGGGSLGSASLTGKATVTAKGQSADGSVSVSLSNNWHDFALIVTVDNVFGLAALIEAASGHTPSQHLEGLAVAAHVEIDLAVCTAATGTYEEGITIEARGSVTGTMLATMKKHLYFMKRLEGAVFSFSLNLPVFSSTPLDLGLVINVADRVPLGKHIALTDVDFSLKIEPFVASLQTTFQGNFSKNPPLTFDVDGKFESDFTVDLSGDMVGTWDNAFGLRGFDLSDVEAEIGFSPNSPFYGLADVGFGSTMQFGHTEISLDGNLAFPNVEDIFLRGEYKHTKSVPTVTDVAHTWNAQNPSLPVDTDLPLVDLKEALFQLATGSGTFAGHSYQAGLEVALVMEVLGMNLDTTLNCTEAGGSLANDCHFAFHVSIDHDVLKELIKKELEHFQLLDSSMPEAQKWELFKLHSAHIGQWSQHNQAHGVPAQFGLDFTFFGKDHSHVVDIKHQKDFFTSFHSFFGTFLKALFHRH